MRKILTSLLLLLYAAASPALDTLKLTAGPDVQGYFLGYENGSFALLGKDQHTVRKLMAATLRLTLDPPRKVDVHPRAGPVEKVELTGFEKGMFQFQVNGAPSTRPVSLVKKIEVPFSAQGNVDTLFGQEGAETIKPGGPLPPEAQLPIAGKATVVHFHYPKSVASVRQGGQVARLARDSKGAVTLRVIEIDDWSDAAVQQYQLKSLPQFWFYRADGTLSTKLVERFTDSEIANAFNNVRN